eukprot:316401-Amphidinium_carterae.1
MSGVRPQMELAALRRCRRVVISESFLMGSHMFAYHLYRATARQKVFPGTIHMPCSEKGWVCSRLCKTLYICCFLVHGASMTLCLLLPVAQPATPLRYCRVGPVHAIDVRDRSSLRLKRPI